MPGGAYIFSDIDRLTPSERELAIAIWKQLAAAAPRTRLLNNPATVLCRYELISELYNTGSNQYRARRLAEGLDGLRYPVFVRSEREHDGSMTPLLHSAAALKRELILARIKGHRTQDLLIIEFCDTSDDGGLFRKYSAFMVGDEVLPRHLLVSRRWHLKKPDIGNPKIACETDAYLEGNPHKEAIRQIFQQANIDYGRIDYSMLGDTPQVWEINTNPLIKQLAVRLTAAFAQLEEGLRDDGGLIPIHLNPQLVTAASLQRKEEVRSRKRRDRISTVLASAPVQGFQGAARLLWSMDRKRDASEAKDRANQPVRVMPDIERIENYEERMQALAVFLNINDRKDQRRSAHALAKLFFELLGTLSPPLFIEAGARDASVSLRARKVLPNTRVVAFEPNPFNTAVFEKEFDYEGNDIEYEHLALADVHGSLRLYVPRTVDGIELPAKNGVSSLLKRASASTMYDEIEVKAVTLDDFFPAAAAEGCCVWIDVEGASGKVIAGGKRLLTQAQLVMIEVEERPVWQDQSLVGDVLKLLSTLGLVPVARDFQWWPDNYNVICIRRGLLERADVGLAIDRFYRDAHSKWRKRKDTRSGARLLRPLHEARVSLMRVFRALSSKSGFM